VDDFVDGLTGITEAESFRYRNGLTTNGLRLHRDGNRLLADGEIKLFDVNGNLLRKATSELSLQGLGRGIFIARNGSDVLKVGVR
jgi:hypothetical protein